MPCWFFSTRRIVIDKGLQAIKFVCDGENRVCHTSDGVSNLVRCEVGVGVEMFGGRRAEFERPGRFFRGFWKEAARVTDMPFRPLDRVELTEVFEEVGVSVPLRLDLAEVNDRGARELFPRVAHDGVRKEVRTQEEVVVGPAGFREFGHAEILSRAESLTEG